jgi:ArsR family transcriptional regulator
MHIGGIPGLKTLLPSAGRIEELSSTHHALSDPVRMTILYLLSVQPLCVCVIRACIGISGSKLSYHLNIMKENGLIVSEQQGNWIIYQITEKGKVFAEEPARM